MPRGKLYPACHIMDDDQIVIDDQVHTVTHRALSRGQVPKDGNRKMNIHTNDGVTLNIRMNEGVRVVSRALDTQLAPDGAWGGSDFDHLTERPEEQLALDWDPS